MQLDETTDIAQCSQLLVFVRYVHINTIKEEFLFCEPLIETTKAIDVFEKVKTFFAMHNFDWQNKKGSLCTDGAPAMLGNTSGFAALVRKEAPNVTVTHCFLHRPLALKTLPTFLKEVLSTAVKVVNYIRAGALNHRVFKRFCQEMGAEYEVLLYHTEVRWLSRGQILKRLIELRTEVLFFLNEKQSQLSVDFEREEFIHGLAYMADIFGHMNDTNLSIQGPAVNMMDAAERLQALLAKLPLWKRRKEVGNYANFPILEDVLLQEEINKTLSSSLQTEICSHLETLQNSIHGYFNTGDLKVAAWILNPFSIDINCIDDGDLAKDDIIDIRTKEMLKFQFNSKGLGEFWCSLKLVYPRLAKLAMAVLIPLVTTYLCESGFSGLVNLKTKNRNRLDIQHDMRIALSKIVLQFHLLIQAKQQQPQFHLLIQAKQQQQSIAMLRNYHGRLNYRFPFKKYHNLNLLCQAFKLNTTGNHEMISKKRFLQLRHKRC